MSQILDALRRAEAQRSRGRVPGLYEAPGQLALAPGRPAAVARRPIVIGAALLLAVGLLAVLQFVQHRAGDPAPQARANSGAADRASTSVDTPTAALPAVIATPVESGAVASLPGLPAVVALPRKVQIPGSRVETRDSSVRPPDERAQTAAPAVLAGSKMAATAASTPPALTASAGALPARQDLPPEIQRSLPPITVSGSVFSSNPAQRMLVVNGELWHEGDQIRPGLVLEQIRRRDAILRFNGLRFTVSP